MAAYPALQSMTAFGSAEVQEHNATYVCEVKSLNSRFLEVNVRLPRFLMALETEIIAYVKKTLARGKVEIVYNIQLSNGLAELPQLNHDVLDYYVGMYKALRQKIVDGFGSGTEIRPIGISDFLRLEGVLESRSRAESSVDHIAHHRGPMIKCLGSALSKLKSERVKEGESLGYAFQTLLGDLERERVSIFEKAKAINSQIYSTYLKRLENLSKKMTEDGIPAVNDLPEERLLAEVSIMADKCDIEEELTRLKSHIDEFNRSLIESEPVGRKLDFICQEMHREINTMSNKLVQSEATKHTLQLKQIVEKIRQQVQNIE